MTSDLLGLPRTTAEVEPQMPQSPASDESAIAQAQESIDRWIAGENQSEVGDAASLRQLAAALDLLGTVSRGPLAKADQGQESAVTTKWGRFDVQGERGRGGFGIVFRAFDPILQREVALKLPRPERMLHGLPADAFVREAQIAAKLSHPGIVRVYEARQYGPIWYIASAYCSGPTLAEWLSEREDPLPPRTSAKIVANIAAAVHHAHSRGVLHLDLKPENILLEPSEDDDAPRPMVTDFGLAGLRLSKEEETNSRVAGTWAYMSPEQRAGETARIGVTADVYALGAILFELSGGVLREATPGDGGMRQFCAELPPEARVPRDLKAICEKCLAIAPEQRYLSARDVQSDLECFIDGRLVSARAPRLSERIALWGRRRPAIATLSALLLLTVAVGMGVMTALWRRAEANLVQLRAEQVRHATTSDQMRRSLLSFAWLAQENRLKPGPVDESADAELALLRRFYDDLQLWTRSEGNDKTLDAALNAAGHSLALAGGMADSDPNRFDEEFAAGLSAWHSLISLRPDEEQWRRGLALHIFTYAKQFVPKRWLWWRRGERAVEMAPDIVQLAAEPYAMLLVEFAGKRPGFEDVSMSYDMLRAAVVLLEERGNSSAVVGERARTLLTAYNQLAKAAQGMSRPKQFIDAVAKANTLVENLPLPAECAPLLAIAAGDALRIISAESERNGFPQNALRELDRAAAYYRVSLDAFPTEASLQLTLVSLWTRTADIHRRLGENERAIPFYRDSLTLLDEALARDPGHRGVRRRRAVTGYILALQLLALGDRASAGAVAEHAASDMDLLRLRKQDSATLWLRAIHCWQVVGDYYVDQDNFDQAVDAYKRSIDLLEQLKPRRGDTPQFLEYEARSINSLARIDSLLQIRNSD